MKIKKILLYLLSMSLIVCGVFLAGNIYVVRETKGKIFNSDASFSSDYDCILILGAGIYGDKPSPILKDRLLKGLELYEKAYANKIVVSGDHGEEYHDEVNVMKNYLIQQGVPSEDIFMDHAGFSTYDSLYRIKEIFGAKKILIVTQKYHLYRAVYIGMQLGLEVKGIYAQEIAYKGYQLYELREVLARFKDLIKCIIQPESTYLGESYDLKGNGDITNDR